MDALMQKKVAEAKQHVADAEKSMKTSLFKRKPDLDSAAASYNSAATCYKVAKDINKAIEYFQKSADCYSQNNSGYTAAKQYEQVAFLANEAKNYALTLESIEKAVDLMITTGTRDSAGILLERGATMLKLNDPEKALRLYKKAIHVSDIEEKNHEMSVFYEHAIALAIKINQLNEAIELIDSSLDVLDKVGVIEQITKAILSAVIIHLSRDDWVSAKNYLDKVKQRYEINNRGLGRVEDLLEAFDEKDDARFKDLIKNYLSFAVDNEVLKMANKIVKSEDWIKNTQEIPNKKPPVNVGNTYNNQVYSEPQIPQPVQVSTGSNSNTYASNNTASSQHQNNNSKPADDADDDFEDGIL